MGEISFPCACCESECSDHDCIDGPCGVAVVNLLEIPVDIGHGCLQKRYAPGDPGAAPYDCGAHPTTDFFANIAGTYVLPRRVGNPGVYRITWDPGDGPTGSINFNRQYSRTNGDMYEPFSDLIVSLTEIEVSFTFAPTGYCNLYTRWTTHLPDGPDPTCGWSGGINTSIMNTFTPAHRILMRDENFIPGPFGWTRPAGYQDTTCQSPLGYGFDDYLSFGEPIPAVQPAFWCLADEHNGATQCDVPVAATQTSLMESQVGTSVPPFQGCEIEIDGNTYFDWEARLLILGNLAAVKSAIEGTTVEFQ